MYREVVADQPTARLISVSTRMTHEAAPALPEISPRRVGFARSSHSLPKH
jgi:hypothetical protein